MSAHTTSSGFSEYTWTFSVAKYGKHGSNRLTEHYRILYWNASQLCLQKWSPSTCHQTYSLSLIENKTLEKRAEKVFQYQSDKYVKIK